VFVWDQEEGRSQIYLRLALPSFLSQTLTTLVVYGLLNAMHVGPPPPSHTRDTENTVQNRNTVQNTENRVHRRLNLIDFFVEDHAKLCSEVVLV
jgi:hypothetical protein